MYIPTLDEPSKRVLRVIRNRGVVPGWQVMSEASISASELSQAADKLMGFGLISASGNTSSTAEIDKAYFNIQPSNGSLAELVLSTPQ